MKVLRKVWSNLFEKRWVRYVARIVVYPYQQLRNKDYQNMLSMNSNKERFSEIYRKNFWNSNESGSGKGSEIIYTENLRSWLLRALPQYGVDIFVDAGCGDFNWMKLVVPELNIKYVGLDIVDSVIEENVAKYSNETTRFKVVDICNDELPHCDFLMIRDCLFHLSFSDIDNFFANLSRTEYKYLLTTTHILQNNHVNENIISGHFRHIDLFTTPFNFDRSNVVECFEDSIEGFTSREMILIAKENVPKSLNYS